MDYAVQRKNMVESQVRPSDVTDRRIIRAMQTLARERFVPEARQSLAYMDGPVPLGAGRSLLAPRILAKMIQAADIDAGATVLDIGAATGYGAAVLATIAGRVVALECDSALVAMARAVEQEHGHVTVVEGELARGWAPEGPYDAILVEGAVEEIAADLIDQLKDGGRLVAIVKRGTTGRATVWHRTGRGFGTLEIFDANADPLPGLTKAPAFSF